MKKRYAIEIPFVGSDAGERVRRVADIGQSAGGGYESKRRAGNSRAAGWLAETDLRLALCGKIYTRIATVTPSLNGTIVGYQSGDLYRISLNSTIARTV